MFNRSQNVSGKALAAGFCSATAASALPLRHLRARTYATSAASLIDAVEDLSQLNPHVLGSKAQPIESFPSDAHRNADAAHDFGTPVRGGRSW